MGMAVVGELKPSLSAGKRAFKRTASTRQTTEWSLADASTDLAVEVGKATFSLHKLPLVSRSGKIRAILTESRDPKKQTRLTLPDVPGGPDTFELVARFCYGLDVGISIANVAALHCAARYLEMTEQSAENNLEALTESFLRQTVLRDAASSLAVLSHCEKLLPAAEELGLAGRLVDAVTSSVAKDINVSALVALGPDFFRRVMQAFKSKGLVDEETTVGILVSYARSPPHGVGASDAYAARKSVPDAEALRRRRALVETVSGLLPCGRAETANGVPVAFLSGLLKAATVSAASRDCVADLEGRVGRRLDQAVLEDILVPAGPGQQHGLYDVDSVARVFAAYVSSLAEDGCRERSDEGGAVERKVAKLMDGYLAEIALDSNVMPDKFIALAELLPAHSRAADDGLYRAVDTFLKVHTDMSDCERRRLCRTIDCRKLSQEACSHAAQNERLPVQMAVQVLYMEQLRLRSAVSGVHDRFFVGSESLQVPKRSSSGAVSPRDNYASVRRENRELKLEVARVRMRLTELERDHSAMKQELVQPTSTLRPCRWLARRLCSSRREKMSDHGDYCCVWFIFWKRGGRRCVSSS